MLAGWLSAARHSSASVPFTSVVSIPNWGARFLTMCRQDPNSAWGATIRSPAFNWLISAANTAAMPLAVAKQRSAPS